MTAPASAYPRTIEDLMPEARKMLGDNGEVPSLNRLMAELHIGNPKAKEVRSHLINEVTLGSVVAEYWANAIAMVEIANRVPTVDEIRHHLNVSNTTASILRDRLLSAYYPDVNAQTTLPGMGDSDTGPDNGPDVSFDDVKIAHGDSLVGPVDLGEVIDVAKSKQAAVDTEPLPEPLPEETEPLPEETEAATDGSKRTVAVWPIVLLALPAFVAVWSGWVGLGAMCGFGVVNLLPGIVDDGSWATLDTSITLPIGAETYGAYALWVWLSGRVPARARRFAAWSALASLVVGALGQVAYHILETQGATHAPAWIVVVVSTLPVIVLGMGAALAHMVRSE